MEIAVECDGEWYHYRIDLESMEQISDDTGYVRKIRVQTRDE